MKSVVYFSTVFTAVMTSLAQSVPSSTAFASEDGQSSRVVKQSTDLQLGPAFLLYDSSTQDTRFETLYLTYKGYLTRFDGPITVAGFIDGIAIQPYTMTESRSGFNTGFRQTFEPGLHTVELYFYDSYGRYDSNYSNNYKGTFEVPVQQMD